MNTNEQIKTGALLDLRTEDEKSMDWQHDELFAGALPVVWKEKTFADVKRYSPRNQYMSLSCVANGGAIMLESAEKKETGKTIVFSHKDLYIRRANKPYGGMNLPDILKLLVQGGAYESQVPSMGLSETPINEEYPVTNDIKQARATHAQDAYVYVARDADSVARVLEMGYPLIAFWYFSEANSYYEWWTNIARIVSNSLGLYDKDALHHQASIVDYGMMNGVKGFFEQDSAGVGTGAGEHKDLRFVPIDFFNIRNYGLAYTIDKKNLDFSQPEKPKYKFTRSLKVGMDGDDVKELQKILVYENCMKLNSPTIHFRGATLAGVKALQLKYKDEILTPVGLKLPTGFVGAQTLKFLNAKYS